LKLSCQIRIEKSPKILTYLPLSPEAKHYPQLKGRR
jgi:hypothetical protein